MPLNAALRCLADQDMMLGELRFDRVEPFFVLSFAYRRAGDFNEAGVFS